MTQDTLTIPQFEMPPATEAELDQMLRDISHEEYELAVLEKQYRAKCAPHKARLEELRRRFAPLAERYAREQFFADPQKKTHQLWHGTLRLRRQPERPLLQDEEAVLRWLRRPSLDYDAGQFIKTQHTLDKAAITSLAIGLHNAGAPLPDGFTWQSEREAFSYATPTPRITDLTEEEPE